MDDSPAPQLRAEVAISLVVPLHDEEENVEGLTNACLEALAAVSKRFELILVDDGSADDTADRIRDAVNRDSRVRGISLRRRFGKGAALAAGLEQARGERIATIDGDLQEDPREIGILLQGLDEGLDLVTGWRRQRQDSWSKRLASRLFNGLVRWTSGLPLRDVNCGFKVMTRAVANELVLTGGRFRFMPLVAGWWGFRVGEREVGHRARRRGRSKFGGERFPGALIDLLAVLSLIRFHSRPGHLLIYSGTLSGLLGVVICGYLSWLRLSRGSIDYRYPLLALGVMLVVIGFQLVATGFLGEWIAYRVRDREASYRIRAEFGAGEPPASVAGKSSNPGPRAG